MGLFSKDKTDRFYEFFSQHAALTHRAGEALLDLVNNFDNLEVRVKAIDDLEHEGDRITHEVMDRMDRTFTTPFDREDIHSLAMQLDDILDNIHEVADKLLLYKASAPRKGFILLSEELVRALAEIVRAIESLPGIKNPRRLLDHCIEINRIENEADAQFHRCIGKLFETEKDPIELIKWKVLYEDLEATMDLCEDVAVTLERIVVKNN